MRLSRRRITRLLKGSRRSCKTRGSRARPSKGGQGPDRTVDHADRTVAHADRTVAHADRTVAHADRTVAHADRTVAHADLEKRLRDITEKLWDGKPDNGQIKGALSALSQVALGPDAKDLNRVGMLVALNDFAAAVDTIRNRAATAERDAQSSLDSPRPRGDVDALLEILSAMRDELERSPRSSSRSVASARWTGWLMQLGTITTIEAEAKKAGLRTMLEESADKCAAPYKEILDDEGLETLTGEDRWNRIADAVWGKWKSGDKTTLTLESHLDDMGWPERAREGLREGLRSHIPSGNSQALTQNVFREALVSAANSGYPPPTLEEVQLQCRVKYTLASPPSDMSRPPRTTDGAPTGQSAGARTTQLASRTASQLGAIREVDRKAAEIVETGALEVSATAEAQPISTISNGDDPKILVGLDQVRSIATHPHVPRVGSISPEALKEHHRVPIYDVYGDGYCGWYSWILGAQNSLALMTEDAKDFVDMGIALAIIRERGVVHERLEVPFIGLSDRVTTLIEEYSSRADGQVELTRILLSRAVDEKRGQLVDTVREIFSVETTSDLPTWDIITAMTIQVMCEDLDNGIMVKIYYNSAAVNEVRDRVLFTQFKVSPIVFAKLAIGYEAEKKGAPPTTYQAWEELTKAEEAVRQARAAWTGLGHAASAAERETAELDLVTAESVYQAKVQEIKQVDSWQAVLTANNVRKELAETLMPLDGQWEAAAREREVIEQEVHALRWLLWSLSEALQPGEADETEPQPGAASEGGSADILERLRTDLDRKLYDSNPTNSAEGFFARRAKIVASALARSKQYPEIRRTILGAFARFAVQRIDLASLLGQPGVGTSRAAGRHGRRLRRG
jgi:hypothetical protein